MILIEIAFTVLVTDLITGFFHWLMDAYGNPNAPILGKHIFEPNRRHHAQPRYLVRHSWLESVFVTSVFVGVVIAVLGCFDLITWHVVLGAVLLVNINQIHKWSHRNHKENGCLVTMLQGFRIIQSREHHAKHHMGQQDSHYNALTNFLNPILDRVRFWRALEWLVDRTFGLKPHRFEPRI